MYSQEWNCAALFPIPTLMYLWAIYIFPGLVYLFGGSKIGRMGIYKCGNWETEHYSSILEKMWPYVVSFLGIHKSEPDIYSWFSPTLHLQCIGELDSSLPLVIQLTSGILSPISGMVAVKNIKIFSRYYHLCCPCTIKVREAFYLPPNEVICLMLILLIPLLTMHQ
jgi:hypothetical protein